MDNKDLIMPVKYLPRRSQGILEERFMADIEYAWLARNRYHNTIVMEEWKRGTISLNIPMAEFKTIRARYYTM